MVLSASVKIPKWRDLSERHEVARRTLLERIDKFFASKEPIPPIAIIGAYGSGKSELLYEGFRHVWKNSKRAAFFMKLEDLLKLLPSELSPDELYDLVSRILQDQLSLLRNALKGGSLDKVFLPDLKEGQTLEDYFGELKIGIDNVSEAVQHDEVILFIDEMEQHYKELRDRILTSDLSPLKAFFEKVEHRKGKHPYFLVMGFALGSAYETLGGAEARRKHSIYIPLPSPNEFSSILPKRESYRNLLWWCSRGRPGWAVKIYEDYGNTFDRAATVYDEGIRRFFDERINGLPYLNSAKWGNLVTSSTARALKKLVLEVRPVAKEELNCPLLELLGEFRDRVMVSDELVPSTKILDAIGKDLDSIAREFQFSNPDPLLIRNYLSHILTAVSNQNGEIAFGAWAEETDAFTMNIIVPLLIILHDLILEFEGDTEKGESSWKFIQAVLTDLGAASDKPNVGKTIGRFRETKKLFKPFYSENDVKYVQPSFKFVEELFPRLIVKPLLILSDKVEKELDQQRIHLKAAVEEKANFLEQSKRVDDLTVRFIFLPSSSCMPKLQEKFFTFMDRSNYLPYEHISIIVNLARDEEPNLDYTKNPELTILEELGKIRIIQLEERQASDFIVSLWRNIQVMNDESRELLQILRKLQESPNIMRHAKRTLQYYAELLDDRLTDIARKVVNEYKTRVSSVFPFKGKDFPIEQISRINDKIRETRTIECIAVAFDLFLERPRATEVLAKLRDMKELTERAKGYKEFLDGYTVAGRDPHPSAAITPIVKYVEDYRSFGKLREYAKNLPLNVPKINWRTFTENLNDSPLEVMLGWNKESKYFLKAIHLRTVIETRKDELLKEIYNVLEKAKDTSRRLAKFGYKINNFNSVLEKLNPKLIEKPLLSTQGVNELVRELDKATEVLNEASKLPPAVLYVAYGFLDVVVDEIEEMREKWEGQSGIEAWNSKFDKLLKLESQLNVLKQQIEKCFTTNRALKEAMIGKLEEIYEKNVKDPLVSAAKEILDGIETTYDLTSGNIRENQPPAIEYEIFDKAMENINNYIDEITSLTSKIDEVCRLLSSIYEKIEEIYSVMVK